MSESWEIAIVLPLGVAANQLMKVESDLRALNMKAVNFNSEDDTRLNLRALDAKLERIREALDVLQKLVAAFSTDLHPKSIKARSDRDD